MRIIKKLVGQIDEEIDDAMKYARCAASHKDSDPALSRMWAELSEQELKHMSRLHDAVVEIINRVQSEGRTIPDGMMEMYEYLHERAIERAAEVRNMLASLR